MVIGMPLGGGQEKTKCLIAGIQLGKMADKPCVLKYYEI